MKSVEIRYGRDYPEIIKSELLLRSAFGFLHDAALTNRDGFNPIRERALQSWITREFQTVQGISFGRFRILAILPERQIHHEEFRVNETPNSLGFSYLARDWNDITGRLIRFDSMQLNLKKNGEIEKVGAVKDIKGSLERLLEIITSPHLVNHVLEVELNTEADVPYLLH